MTAYEWVKSELRPIEAAVLILGGLLVLWQVHEYGTRRAQIATEQIHHEEAMQQIASLGDQVKASVASKAQSDAVAAQQAQILANQQQAQQALVAGLAAIQAANRQQVSAVQTMTPDQLVSALKTLGITSQVTSAEAKQIVTTATEEKGCEAERVNLAGQITNCRDQVSTGQQIIQAQRQSLADLAQQVTLQQQIEKATTQDYEQQLKVARGGSRFDRLLKVAEAFAVGYGIRAATHR